MLPSSQQSHSLIRTPAQLTLLLSQLAHCPAQPCCPPHYCRDCQITRSDLSPSLLLPFSSLSAQLTRPNSRSAKFPPPPLAPSPGRPPARLPDPLSCPPARSNRSLAQPSHPLYCPVRSANLPLRSLSNTPAQPPTRLLRKFVRSSTQLPLPLTQVAHYLTPLSLPALLIYPLSFLKDPGRTRVGG